MTTGMEKPSLFPVKVIFHPPLYARVGMWKFWGLRAWHMQVGRSSLVGDLPGLPYANLVKNKTMVDCLYCIGIKALQGRTATQAGSKPDAASRPS